MTSPVVWRLDGVLLDVLTELGVTLERVEAGAYVVTLPGEHGRSTLVWLVAGEQSVAVEAFVLHVIDVGDPAVHAALRHAEADPAGLTDAEYLALLGADGADLDALAALADDVRRQVNGDDVTATGLFVEHFQQHNTIWNGERGRVVLYQNELPYDPPTQADWTQPDGTLGFAGYKVGDQVLFSPDDQHEVEVHGEDLVILRERDVHAVAAERIEESTGLYL